MSTELTVVQQASLDAQQPSILYKRGANVASACAEIVTKTAQTIQGHRYIRVEGWEAIAAAWGCTPEIVDAKETSLKGKQGVIAEAILKRDADGVTLSRGFGFVGYDEDPKAAPYAVFAKAQTRAVSRVCRHKFAFIAVMIDPDLKTTPAEEVPEEGFTKTTTIIKPKFTQETLLVHHENPSPTPTDTLLQGVLENVTQNTVNDTTWTQGFINKRRVFTKDSTIGEAMMFTSGTEVILGIKPGKKPNEYWVQAVTPVQEAEEEAP